jgi:hypothetical protein
MTPRRPSAATPAWRFGACTALLALSISAVAQESASSLAAPPPPQPTPAPASAPQVAESQPPGGAVERRSGLRLTARLGWDYAFEEFLHVTYDDGSSARLGANGGFALAAGAAFLPLAGGRLETRATAGVKYDVVIGSNGRAFFFGFPLEVLEAWNVRPLRLSAGLSLLLFPRVRGSGLLAGSDLDLRSSLGVVGQAEWVVPFRGGAPGSISFGLRYLWQRLELATGGDARDASALGATFGVTL